MDRIKRLGRRIFVYPIVDLLVRLRIHPNLITFASLFLAMGSFLFYWHGQFLAGAVLLLLCGLFDTFDGEIARRTGQSSRLGSFLDSTIDRVNEFLVYLGLFIFYRNRSVLVLAIILIAMFGSLMVSYTRAKGEALGISPQVGIFERFIRFLMLIIGSVLGPNLMVYVLVILAIGTFQTMIERIIFVRRQSQN